MQDYLYSSLSIVAIAIHLILNFDLLSGRGAVTAKSQQYRGFLLSILAYYITDVGWGLIAGLGWTRVLYYETILYFLALSAVILTWCRFIIVFLELDGWSARLLSLAGQMLLAFNVVGLAVNHFNGCFFYFDADGNYMTGIVRYISFFIQLALNIVTAIFAFIKAVGSRGVAHKRNMLVFLLGLTMTVAFSIQLIWPLLPFTALGCLIGSCFFRAYVIDDEIEEMRNAVIEREQAVKHMAELEAALERARAAEQSRSTFFSIVSHDIRTPLNAILGYSELLQGDMATRQERDEALKSISASGKVLLQLVNDVLDFARIDSGKMTLLPVPVKLEGLTDEVFSTFRLAASEKGVRLINRTGGIPVVVLDEHRVRQILFNLVGNAMKFTNSGSVTVSATYDGSSLKVSVADTGCGIPHDMLGRIFDPFVQVLDPSHSASRASGSGLGLSICKRLAEIMGGELSVESEQAKGSTFTITIPGVPTSEAEARASILANHVVELKNPPNRVLVVDDSAMNRSVLKAFLKKAGVGSIDYACDGSEAMTKIRSAANDGNAYDFVFTDFWMPNMNGVELVERLRADSSFRNLPVFAVTADSELQNDERSKLFTGILFKPLMYDMLVGAIASCDA